MTIFSLEKIPTFNWNPPEDPSNPRPFASALRGPARALPHPDRPAGLRPRLHLLRHLPRPPGLRRRHHLREAVVRWRPVGLGNPPVPPPLRSRRLRNPADEGPRSQGQSKGRRTLRPGRDPTYFTYLTHLILESTFRSNTGAPWRPRTSPFPV
jgi:hypothetical protein